MTQPDQSELESDIEMLLLRVYNGEYDRSASQTLADVKKRIVSHITANYTPNEQVKERERDARVEELTSLLSMQRNKPTRVLLKDAVNIAYNRVCELTIDKE